MGPSLSRWGSNRPFGSPIRSRTPSTSPGSLQFDRGRRPPRAGRRSFPPGGVPALQLRLGTYPRGVGRALGLKEARLLHEEEGRGEKCTGRRGGGEVKG